MEKEREHIGQNTSFRYTTSMFYKFVIQRTLLLRAFEYKTSKMWHVSSFMSSTGVILKAVTLRFPAKDRTWPYTRTYVFSLNAGALCSSWPFSYTDSTQRWAQQHFWYTYLRHKIKKLTVPWPSGCQDREHKGFLCIKNTMTMITCTSHQNTDTTHNY